MAFAFIAGNAQTIILENKITHPNPASLNPFNLGTVAAQGVSGIGPGRGPNLSPIATADIYTVTPYNVPQPDTNRYIEFTISPDSGYALNLSTFEFRANLSGAPNLSPYVVRSNADNYTVNVPFTKTAFGPAIINLSGGDFQDVTASVTLRVYVYGSADVNSNIGIIEYLWRGSVEAAAGIDDVSVYKTKLFPNPVKDVLQIDSAETVTSIEVYNMAGQTVAQAVGTTIKETNLSHLPAGAYMIKIISGDKTTVDKIIKL